MRVDAVAKGAVVLPDDVHASIMDELDTLAKSAGGKKGDGSPHRRQSQGSQRIGPATGLIYGIGIFGGRQLGTDLIQEQKPEATAATATSARCHTC